MKSTYWFGNWKPPYGIEFALDSLNGVIVVLICIMGLISTIYSMPFFDGFSRFKTARLLFDPVSVGHRPSWHVVHW